MEKLKLHHFNAGSMSPSWRMYNQVHANNELIVPFRGKLIVTGKDNQELIVEPGQTVLYPAGCFHEEATGSKENLEIIYLAFSGDTGIQHLHRQPDRDGKIRILIQWLQNTRSLPESDQKTFQDLYFQVIMAEFLSMSSQNPEFQLVNNARLYMLKHLGDPIRVEDLAKNASLSKYHFIRTYKQHAGASPMADLRRLRIEEAQSLVIAGNLPLKAIAEITGFADEFHFSKTFRKILGRSPGSLRNKL